MKITLETTEHGNEINTKRYVAVENGYDHGDLCETKDLLTSALLAWGYHQTTINELFGENE